MRTSWIVSLFIFIILAPFALAQGTGNIHGTATDPTGSVIPGATVTALLVERGVGRTVTSNERGEFLFPLLPVGVYSVTVAAGGFRPRQ